MGDRVLAICTVVGALIYLYADAQLPKLEIGDPLGPKVFPAMVGIGLLVSGLLLLFEIRKKRVQVAKDPHALREERLHRMILVSMAVWTAVYYFAFEPVGYLISTMVYMLPVLTYFNRGRWLMNAMVSVGFTLVAYAVFAKFLQVSMPHGIFAF